MAVAEARQVSRRWLLCAVAAVACVLLASLVFAFCVTEYGGSDADASPVPDCLNWHGRKLATVPR